MMKSRGNGREWVAKALLAVSVVLIAVSLVLPYWKIKVTAPQYPKGLYITIFVNHLEGDVSEIDGLNHYIGMKPMEKAAKFERTISMYGVSAVALSLFLAVFLRRRWSVIFILPAILFPVFFAGDLYWWLRDYGLHLDPHAALSSSIKPFIPPLFGKGIIGQFGAIAQFQIGFYLTAAAGLLSLAAGILRLQQKRPALQQILVPVVGILSLLLFSTGAFAKTITMSPGERIDQALERAESGDTIQVQNGVYPGPWNISKSVKLEGVNFPVIDGGGKGTVVKLAAPEIEFKDFTVRNSGDILSKEDSGILVSSPKVIVEGNRIENVLFGISLNRAPGTLIKDNILRGKNLDQPRKGDLIRVWYSDDVTLEGNETYEGRDAVIWFSKRIVLRGNKFQQGRYGLHYMYCDDSIVENNTFAKNSVGIYLMYSQRIHLKGNQIIGNRGPSGFGVGERRNQLIRLLNAGKTPARHRRHLSQQLLGRRAARTLHADAAKSHFADESPSEFVKHLVR